MTMLSNLDTRCPIAFPERTGFRGKRHTTKARRWQVVSCSDPFLKDTWLDYEVAKSLLKAGDFYPPYTVLRIISGSKTIQVTVKGTQVFDEEGDSVNL